MKMESTTICSSQRQKAAVIWDNEGRAHDGSKDGCAAHA